MSESAFGVDHGKIEKAMRPGEIARGLRSVKRGNKVLRQEGKMNPIKAAGYAPENFKSGARAARANRLTGKKWSD